MPKHHTVRVCKITEYLGKKEAFEWAGKVTSFVAMLHRKPQKNGGRTTYAYAVVRVLKAGEILPGRVFEARKAELLPVENKSAIVNNGNRKTIG